MSNKFINYLKENLNNIESILYNVILNKEEFLILKDLNFNIKSKEIPNGVYNYFLYKLKKTPFKHDFIIKEVPEICYPIFRTILIHNKEIIINYKLFIENDLILKEFIKLNIDNFLEKFYNFNKNIENLLENTELMSFLCVLIKENINYQTFFNFKIIFKKLSIENNKLKIMILVECLKYFKIKNEIEEFLIRVLKTSNKYYNTIININEILLKNDKLKFGLFNVLYEKYNLGIDILYIKNYLNENKLKFVSIFTQIFNYFKDTKLIQELFNVENYEFYKPIKRNYFYFARCILNNKLEIEDDNVEVKALIMLNGYKPRVHNISKLIFHIIYFSEYQTVCIYKILDHIIKSGYSIDKYLKYFVERENCENLDIFLRKYNISLNEKSFYKIIDEKYGIPVIPCKYQSNLELKPVFVKLESFIEYAMTKFKPCELTLEEQSLVGNIVKMEVEKINSDFNTFQEHCICILEKFLIKIKNVKNHQFYLFCIQEIVKGVEIPERLKKYFEEFKFTKYYYDYPLKYKEINCFIDYSNFLKSLFNKLNKHDFLKYLVLLDNEVLEYAVLSLIKFNNLLDLDIFLDYKDFKILSFFLKINPFCKSNIISNEIILRYSLILNNFYGIIYVLNELDNEYKLMYLSISYYILEDYDSVKLLIKEMTGNERLFFECCLKKEFDKAAVFHTFKVPYMDNVLLEISQDIKSMEIEHLSITNCIDLEGITSPRQKVFYTYREALIRPLLYQTENSAILHVLADLRMLCESNNLLKTLEIIEKRRNLSYDSNTILYLHRKLLSEYFSLYVKCHTGFESYLLSLEKQYIQLLLNTKNFYKAYELIFESLQKTDLKYELSEYFMAIGRKEEAIDILTNYIKENGNEKYKAAVRLAEITNSGSFYHEAINIFNDNENSKKLNINFKVEKAHFQLINSRREFYTEKRVNLFPCYDNTRRLGLVTNRISIDEKRRLLDKLYFCAAKHFELTNLSLAIEFYYKAFAYNFEAIPRFFHLINDKNCNNFINEIINSKLELVVPYFNQIAVKIGKNCFYRVVLSLLEKFPEKLVWNCLILLNSKKKSLRESFMKLQNDLSLKPKIVLMHVIKFSKKLIEISAKEFIVSLENEDLFVEDCYLPNGIKLFKVENEIKIFSSLQKPKRIFLVGEDGITYSFLLKNNDDLRKDARFMDMNYLLNKIFLNTKKEYRIITYGVFPINHECGIIQMRENLIHLMDIYKKYHSYPRKILNKKSLGSSYEEICKIKTPFLNNYFNKEFLDLEDNYKKRTNFIVTYGIMNIVGYFIGLGDRHAENIMFDKNTFETVHVDLNCIFDGGKDLHVAERVPFRLTQNIYDGISTRKGLYLSVLKETLEIMKKNEDVIIANLLSYVHDPLSSWKKKTAPIETINKLKEKLQFIDSDKKVKELVEEASDPKNLSAMWIGWAAFI